MLAKNVSELALSENHHVKAEIFKAFKTRPGVTQNRSNLEPEKAVQASSRKRQRASVDCSQSGESSKPRKRVHQATEQCRDDRIQLLEKENKALKNENKGLKKRLLKQFACPICPTRSFNRSDGLYSHLQKGDEEHKRLAQERYENTKCEICGKECARWSDLKKHMAVHEQKVVGSAGELHFEPDATVSPSLNHCLVPSTAQDTAPDKTSLVVTKDSTLEAPWPIDPSASLVSEDMVQSLGEQTVSRPPSTPCLKQALGFSNSPARGLDFTPPGYIHTSPYSKNVVIMQASGISNSLAHGLDVAPPNYINPSTYGNNTVIVQGPGFWNSSAHRLDSSASGFTHPLLYDNNSISVQAPGFSNSPARGLDFAPPTYIHSTPHSDNTGTVQAPGFSNSPARGLDFKYQDYTHPPYGNDTLKAPSFSNSTARGLDLAPSHNPRPSPYNVVTHEAPSPWSQPCTAEQNSASLNRVGSRQDYISICGAQPPVSISSQGTMQSMGDMQLVEML